MISVEAARWLVEHLDPAAIARQTWRASAAGEDGRAREAAAILDLRTGRVEYRSWDRERVLLPSARRVVLATTTAARREDVEAGAARSASVPPSDEVVEEGVVRAAAREGLDLADIESQLQRAFEVRGFGARRRNQRP